MSDYVTVLTTTDSKEAAVRLGRALVERRLVACANVIPGVHSIFRWRGEVQEASEYLVLMKTRAEQYEALEAAMDDVHPYDVPELIALPVDRGSGDYLAWVDESVDRSR